LITGWIIAAALAAEPIVDLHATGLVEDRLGGGLGGGIGAAWPHAELVLSVDAMFADDDGVRARGFARPRLHLFPAAAEGPRGHLVVGGGAWNDAAGIAPVAEVGVGIDLGAGSLRPRVVASFAAGPEQPGRALLTVGFVRHPSPEPALEPVAEVPRFDAAMVWVPDPVCEWLPPDDASGRWEQAAVRSDPTETNVIADPDAASGTADGESAPVGDLVVAALPGDVVQVEGTLLAVDADGVAWTQAPPGRTEIVVRGGGREERATVALAAEGTVWYAAPAPEQSIRVTFPAGSAELPASSEVALRTFHELLEGWHVEVWGSFSPEGNAFDNEALAHARAEAIAAALEAQGLSPERIRVLPARLPEPGVPPEQQRAAVLTPVEPR